MEKLKVKLLAFPAADHQFFSKAKKRLIKLFHQDKVEFVNKEPEVLVFLSGGSESVALQSVHEYGFYLILASAEGNSWAAATEVKAWMNQNNISSILVDHTSPDAADFINTFYLIKNGLKKLRGQRFGLIGETSEWLVNSSIDPYVIKTKLGVDQVDIPWNAINVKEKHDVAADFISFFKGGQQEELIESGRIYETLSKVVANCKLDALTVECFSLIGACNATACLALSKLSMDGKAAGCEGDTCSLLGMMMVKEFFGLVPWIANVAYVSKNRVTFAHCTVPGNLLKEFSIDSHYESGKSLAISGTLKTETVTIFRLDHTLSKAFIGVGKIIKTHPQKDMCRTQVVVDVNSEIIHYLMNYPLGNHHLILPGDQVLGLQLAMRMLKIELV